MEPPVPGARRYLFCVVSLVAFTAALAAALVVFLGLRFPARDALEPACFTAALCLGAWAYRRRAPQFELALTSLAIITTFTAFYSVLMYAIGSIPGPLTDRLLQSWDAACGMHLPDIVAWAETHPLANRWLRGAYNSVMIQTAGVIVLLSFTRDVRSLRGFNIQFMVAALLTMGLFAVFPADGPCACYDYAVAPGLDRYVQHLHELRSGARDVVTWRNAEGLVTFPSFHTTWAILLAWSVRRRRGLNLAMGLLNLAVIASTLTTGLHYFIDVPGGALVAVAAIAIESRIARWCDFKPAATEARPPGRTVNFRVISDADIDALRAAAPVGQEV